MILFQLGLTSLMDACLKGQGQLVKVLLAAGADTELLNEVNL